jgi:hypothetical protein
VIGKRNIGDLHWKEESDLLGEEVRERDQIGDFDANGVFLPSSLSSVPETAKEDAQEKAGDFGAFGVLPMYIQPTLTSRNAQRPQHLNVSISSYAQAILTTTTTVLIIQHWSRYCSLVYGV